MRTQSHVQTPPARFAAKAASIEEFFEDHMSRSELMLDELDEKLHVEKEQYPEDEVVEDPEEWIHSLYTRDITPRL
ncbi:MAG: hypothetical protein ABIR96_02875 [Bdellovibrionota bacterium]